MKHLAGNCHDIVSLAATHIRVLHQAVGNDTIELKWRFEATLNVPTSPKIKPYTGTTIYHIKDGKVDQHIETWDISALDAFISVFIPSFGAPAARPL